MSKARDLADLPAGSGNLDVDGTVTADGLDVNSGSTSSSMALRNSGTSFLNIYSDVNGVAILDVDSNDTGVAPRFQIDVGDTQAFRITEGGDIFFYEDTGTTPKFFWDASAERLGIGTGTSSPQNNLEISANSPTVRLTNTDGSGNLQITHTSSSYSYGGVGSNQALIYSLDDVSLFADGSHSVKFHTNSSERMRIDSSGNVGIGTTSPAVRLSGTVFTINDNVTSGIELANSGSQAGEIFSSSTDTYISERRSGSLIFRTAGSNERARIDSSGCVSIGTSSSANTLLNVQEPNSSQTDGAIFRAATTSSFNGSNAVFIQTHGFYSANRGHHGLCFKNNDDNAGRSNREIIFRNYANSEVGSVRTTTTGTSYNTTSDYRTKENVVDLTDATTRLNQLDVKRFNFTADPDTTVDGFLAHEVQAVVPEAVTGTKDEVDADGNPVYQGIDQSKLVPLLTAALQEAIAKIDALETRIETLESK